jgi:hypothetical protein
MAVLGELSPGSRILPLVCARFVCSPRNRSWKGSREHRVVLDHSVTG